MVQDPNKFRLMAVKGEKKTFEITHENTEVIAEWIKVVNGVLETQSDFLKGLLFIIF